MRLSPGRVFLVAALTAIGILPGLVLVLAFGDPAFFGVILLGGLAGFGIGISGAFYRTSLLGSVRRVCKGVAFILIEYNLGFGREIARTEHEPVGHLLLPADTAEPAAAVAYERATTRGAWCGAAAAASAGFTVVWYAKLEPEPLERLLLSALFAVIFAVVGGPFGSAVGALWVPGRHRSRIIVGCVAGSVIGCGPLIIALNTPVKNADHVGWALLALFAIAGTVAGLRADESQPKDGPASE